MATDLNRDRLKSEVIWEFGSFQFDSSTHELKKLGLPIRLQAMPAKILTLLLERRGKVVRREEIRRALWTDDVVVDFDTGLNTAIRKLRRALSDEADVPKYIATLPRIGYRFLVPAMSRQSSDVHKPFPAAVPPPLPRPPVAQPPAVEPVPAPVHRRGRRPLLVAGLLAIGVVASSLVWWRDSSASRPVARTTLVLPPEHQMLLARGRRVAISPDGHRVAYVAHRDGAPRVFVRDLGRTSTIELPFRALGGVTFSPRGDELAYFRDPGEVVRYRFSDRQTEVLSGAPAKSLTSLVWVEPDSIWASQLGGREGAEVSIWRSSGNRLMPFTSPFDSQGDDYITPSDWDPRRQWLLATTQTNPIERTTVLIHAPTGRTTVVARPGRGLRLLPTGHAVFWKEWKIFGIGIDSSSGAPIGSPFELIADVEPGGWSDIDADFSRDGTLVFVPRDEPPDTHLEWMERGGRSAPFHLPPGPYEPVDFSADGRRLLLRRTGPDGPRISLWLQDTATGETRKLIDNLRQLEGACFSPDGNSFALAADVGDIPFTNIFVARLDRPTELLRLTENSALGQSVQQWSDSGTIVYTEGTAAKTLRDIWEVAPVPGAKPSPLAYTKADEYEPAISPDGQWLAYSENEVLRVRKREAAPGQEIIVGPGGGPIWSRNGREIFYRSLDGMRAASFDNGRTGVSAFLFRLDGMRFRGWNRGYLLHPQSQRFLLIRKVYNPASGRRIEVVFNWFREVAEKSPNRR